MFLKNVIFSKLKKKRSGSWKTGKEYQSKPEISRWCCALIRITWELLKLLMHTQYPRITKPEFMGVEGTQQWFQTCADKFGNHWPGLPFSTFSSVAQSRLTLCDPMDFITNSWSLLKLMSIESVMPSNHLILNLTGTLASPGKLLKLPLLVHLP